MNGYRELKEIAWRCNMELPKLGLALHTFGNASAVDRARGVIAIKPSGVPYDELRADMMVVVALDNRVVEGALRPSSDTKTHTLLYRRFDRIGGVVHTHSSYAVAWAQAGKPVPVLGTTHADHLPSDIPCTKRMTVRMIRGEYEEETGNLIVSTLARTSYEEVPMVLVAGHGPFAWGATPEKAVYHSLMLEELSKIAYLTLQINRAAPRLGRPLIEKHYQRKHGPDSYYGQTGPTPKKGDRE
jgi:L-ribulose-5-phosphate 4-epimerase